MKTVSFVVFLVLLHFRSSGQILVNGVDINKLEIDYCHLYAENGSVLSLADVWVDYGQRFSKRSVDRLMSFDEEGRPRRFNSATEALNFMTANGWELVSWQLTDSNGSPETFIYLLRRKRKPTERLGIR